MQLASAGDLEGICVLGILHAEGNVGVQLSVQSVAQMAGGDVFSFLTCQRAVIYTEVHGDRRILDLLERDRVRFIHGADRVTDVKIFNAGQSDDGSDGSSLDRNLLQAVELIQLGDADLLLLGAVMVVDQQRVLVHLDGAPVDLADTDAPHIFIVIDGGDQHLQGAFRLTLRSRDVVHDGLKERGHVGRLIADLLDRIAFLGGCEDKRAVQLLVGGIQIHQKFQGFINDLVRTRAGAVDLIDTDDKGQVQSQRLLGDETRLGHGAFKCVHHENNAVDHLQDTLDFTAEVRVAGSIYDIDLSAVVGDGCILGQDRDAALTFDIAGVHDTFRNLLVLAEHAALAEQAVDKCRLAVVDMCNDRYISYIFSDHSDSFLFHIYSVAENMCYFNTTSRHCKA